MRRAAAFIAIIVAICLTVPAAVYTDGLMESRLVAASTARGIEPCTHGGDVFCSHLPVVAIAADGEIGRYTDIWCTVTVYDNGYRNHLTDEPDFTTHSTIRYRGQSSYEFAKKQYRLEFYEEPVPETARRDIAVMGMLAESDWVLNGPFLDKTFMRNRLAYDVARETMEWAPDTRFCEVWLNGEYQGVYVMTESVKPSEERLNLSDYSLLSGRTPYLLLIDRFEIKETYAGTFGFLSVQRSGALYIRYPRPDELTDIQFDWIEADFSAFERALYSDYFDDPEKGYRSYIDLDSFATYYVINEFTSNNDAGSFSTYYYRDFDEKIKMGPVWDFNNAMDNYVGVTYPADEFHLADNNHFAAMIKDRAFVDAVVAKYRELRQGALSEESLMARIDSYRQELGDAVDRNYEVWGYIFGYHMLGPDDAREYASHEEAVAQLKGYIRERGDFLDANIESLYRYCVN